MAALIVPSLAIAAANRPLLVVDTNNNRALLFRSPFRNNEVASFVLGQHDFASALTGTTQNLLGGAPISAAWDRHGAVWVAEEINNRVLRFSPPFVNGKKANLVIGQPNFVSANASTSQNGLSNPTYVTFDKSNDLWVADRNNCRVLEYKPPFRNGMNASVVIGEPDFNTVACTPATPTVSQNLMDQTEGVTFDAEGDLWAVDRGANRVLEFTPPFASGMNATTVIGQSDFTSVGAQASDHGLHYPNGIAFLNGNLWVADTLNHRTLEFEPAFANGMSASIVLGQSDFSSTTCSTTQNGECWAFAVAGDPKGNLWLADLANCRVLEYQPDSSGQFSTNQDASLVLGQPDFTTGTCATSRTETSQPQGVAIGSSP